MMRTRNPNSWRWWTVGGVAVLSAACATRNPSLEQARAAYTQARQDTQVARYAPVALSQAGQMLGEAERAGNRDETTHLAYLAQRKVDLARAMAQNRVAEEHSRQFLGERDRMLLDIRNREVQELQGQLQAKNTDRGPMVTLGDVLFETGQAALKPGTRQKLGQLVGFLQSHGDRQVVIEGHTDSRGSDAYNEELSLRRAEAVRDFLTDNGIDPGRIAARGRGEGYPVASNDTAAGRLQNRRVEVFLPTRAEAAQGR